MKEYILTQKDNTACPIIKSNGFDFVKELAPHVIRHVTLHFSDGNKAVLPVLTTYAPVYGGTQLVPLAEFKNIVNSVPGARLV